MISLKKIKKEFIIGNQVVRAIKEVDLEIKQGDYLAIMGTSGSGKSTLLNILGCLDVPTQGSYEIEGNNVVDLDDNQLSQIRGSQIGFVFQAYNLLPDLTVLENIKLPLIYQKNRRDEDDAEAIRLAHLVGLKGRLDHKPNELSGGQQQRVAIARALINNPVLILADEPTGNLDTQTEAEILDLFEELNAMGKTIVVVTHEDEVGERAKRVIVMRDGLIQSEKDNNHE